MVVRQEPESPCVRNGKPLVKEDGSVWLLRTKVLVPLNFSCCLIQALAYTTVYSVLICHLDSFFTLSKV